MKIKEQIQANTHRKYWTSQLEIRKEQSCKVSEPSLYQKLVFFINEPVICLNEVPIKKSKIIKKDKYLHHDFACLFLLFERV